MFDLLGKNPILAVWIAYIAGAGTSLTPCVYPLIPVIVGVIGRQASSRTKSFALSLVYVLGLSFTYAVLGVVASLGGKVFGLTAYNPWVNLLVGLVLLVLGLSMFDIIKLPFVGIRGAGTAEFKGGWIGILFMGLVSGLVAAPCSTPVLGSILTFAAVNKSILMGGILLFVYGFGTGTLLLVAGIFAGVASSLPKSGKWMIVVKNVFAGIIILASFYFFYRVIKVI